MYKKLSIIIILINLAFLLYCDIVTNVKNIYSNLDTFEADISQINYFSQIDQSLTSNGKLFIQNDSLVILYTEPAFQFIKLENNIITIYSRQENTAIITKDHNIFSQNIFKFSDLLNNELSFLSKDDSLLEYEININNQQIKNIKIYINEINYQIEKVSYSDDLNNIVNILISAQIFNHPLSQNIDEFALPNDVMIIENP